MEIRKEGTLDVICAWRLGSRLFHPSALRVEYGPVDLFHPDEVGAAFRPAQVRVCFGRSASSSCKSSSSAPWSSMACCKSAVQPDLAAARRSHQSLMSRWTSALTIAHGYGTRKSRVGFNGLGKLRRDQHEGFLRLVRGCVWTYWRRTWLVDVDHNSEVHLWANGRGVRTFLQPS